MTGEVSQPRCLEELSYVAQLHLLERTGQRVPGAVDEEVDTPVVGMDLLDESSDGGLVGDVEPAGLQAPGLQALESSRIAAYGEHRVIAGL